MQKRTCRMISGIEKTLLAVLLVLGMLLPAAAFAVNEEAGTVPGGSGNHAGGAGTENAESAGSGDPAAAGRTLVASEGMVLADDAYFTAEVTALRTQENGEVRVELFLRNNTADYLEISTGNIIVNGCVFDDYLWQSLRGEERALYNFTLPADRLTEYGLESIDEIRLSFEVLQEAGEYWETVDRVTAAVYPTGMEPGSVTPPATDNPWAQVTYEDENFSLQVTDAKYIDESCYEVDLCLTNRSEADLTLVINGATADGVAAESFGYYALPYGTQNRVALYIPTQELQDAGIMDLDELAFTVEVFFGSDAYAQEMPAYTQDFCFRPAKG